MREQVNKLIDHSNNSTFPLKKSIMKSSTFKKKPKNQSIEEP